MSATRHPINKNLSVVYETHWNHLPLLPQPQGLIEQYLMQIRQILGNALGDYSRVCVMLFVLRFPKDIDPQVIPAAISRFIDSLRAQINHTQAYKRKHRQRVYPCKLRYLWASEQESGEYCHYHVAIVLNKDAYFKLGNYNIFDPSQQDGEQAQDKAQNMYARIVYAWASALKRIPEHVQGLVHIPDNAVYVIERMTNNYPAQFQAVFQRLSYYAKADTKYYGSGKRHFGCSQE